MIDSFEHQMLLQEHAYRHISSEIHDNIALSLTLSKLYLQNPDFSQPHQLQKRIDTSLSLIKKTIVDLNRLSKSLNPDIVERFGFLSSVQELVNAIQPSGLFSVELTIHGNEPLLTTNDKLILFRIVQEAINNIIKHSFAKHINICVLTEDAQLVMNIADDGCGFNLTAEQKTGSGISNMTQRAKLLNATFYINPQPGGTVINIAVPLKINASPHARQHCY